MPFSHLLMEGFVLLLPLLHLLHQILLRFLFACWADANAGLVTIFHGQLTPQFRTFTVPVRVRRWTEGVVNAWIDCTERKYVPMTAASTS